MDYEVKNKKMELQPIQNLIYEMRGYKVMLDFDIAAMYGVQTGRLNQAVKRNWRRFPEDFMFQLTSDEWENLKSQFAMSSQIVITSHKKRPKSALPFAFTEQGVAMLSGVLNSEVAIDANIKIMRAFVAVRQLVHNQPVSSEMKELQREMTKLKQYVEETFTDCTDINEDTRLQLEQLNRLFAEMTQNRLPAKPRRKIGFFTEEQRNKKEDIIE